MYERFTVEIIGIELLRECFTLDEATGDLFWKERPVHHFRNERQARATNSSMAGKKAGFVRPSGYVGMRLLGKNHLAHRVVFAMHHGIGLDEVPPILDHIDGNTQNNRPSNLRGATIKQNSMNRRMKKNNIHGMIGAQPVGDGSWISTIKVDGKRVHLGTFNTMEEAGAAYIGAAKILRGDFFRENASTRTQAAA